MKTMICCDAHHCPHASTCKHGSEHEEFEGHCSTRCNLEGGISGAFCLPVVALSEYQESAIAHLLTAKAGLIAGAANIDKQIEAIKRGQIRTPSKGT